MGAPTTYSFSDIKMVISHPAYPAYTVNGNGVGEINIEYANDNTTQDLAADGTVMISKIEANNGTVTISMQQTSPMHQWMKGFFNALRSQPTNMWAKANINVSSPAGGFDNIALSGVSFQKRAAQPYQAQGQMVTWSFMFANGQTIGSTLAAINLNTSATILNNL